GDAVKAGLVDDYGVRRLELVEVELLRHYANASLGSLQLPIDIVPKNASGTAGLIDEGGDDTDERRFTGAVGAEKREEIALLDIEVHALERLYPVFVGLGQSANRQCIHGGKDRISGVRTQQNCEGTA